MKVEGSRTVLRFILALLLSVALVACDKPLARVEGSGSDGSPLSDGTTGEDGAFSDAEHDGSTLDADLASSLDTVDGATLPDGDDDVAADVDLEQPLVGGAKVLWNFPAGGVFQQANFFNYPWPESRRTNADGTLAMAGFPNPEDATAKCQLALPNVLMNLLLKALSPHQYRQYLLDVVNSSMRAFGNNAGVYFRFSAPIDQSRLPSPELSLGDDSPIWLVNVDPQSPRRGERIPLSVKFYGATTRYVQANTLAILPYPGFPLAPGSLYAAVVKRSLGDALGDPLSLSERFEPLKAVPGSGASEQHKLYDSVFNYLEGSVGLKRSEIAAMTVYRTQDPTQRLRALAPQIEALNPLLADFKVTGATFDKNRGLYRVQGTFNMVIYQRGVPPYLPKIDLNLLNFSKSVFHLEPSDHSGELLSGEPQTDLESPDPNKPRLETIPFVLTIPAQLVTANGPETLNLPVVLYSHGSGGSRFTGLSVEAPALAPLGIALFAIDQVMHGDRSHSDNIDPELKEKVAAFLDLLTDVIRGGAFQFNPLNLHAADGNVLQSAVDYFWQAHLLAAPQTALQATFTVDGQKLVRTIRFQPQNIFFMGHSLGALIGPFATLSTKIRGMMLSESGGHLISTLLTKTQPSDPIDIKKVFDYLICDGELTEHHPMLSAAMTFFESSDSLNYARFIAKQPGPFGPKHLFLTQGTEDHYAPIEGTHALATAAFAQQVGPALTDVLGQKLLGYGPPSGDLMGNLVVDGQAITIGFKEYHGDPAVCPDDHFVYFCVPRAKQDWIDFFETMLNQPLPLIKAGN